MQRVSVSVRGKNEALAAAEGGASIVDVEYPETPLGAPYPFNIEAVRGGLRDGGHPGVLVATNIGARPHERPNACQAALGAALAGADIVKFGLAELSLEPAVYLGREIVRGVRHWFPERRSIVAVFADEDLRRSLDPLEEGPHLALRIGAHGLLIDTFHKTGSGDLLAHLQIAEIHHWVRRVHADGLEAWIAGGIPREAMPELWETGVDVICVRTAVCRPGKGVGRHGEVDRGLVEAVARTRPEIGTAGAPSDPSRGPMATAVRTP